MSRSSEVAVMLLFVRTVVKAIEEIGLAREEIKQLKLKNGKTASVDFVIKNEKGDSIGVKETETGQVELIAADPESLSSLASINQIRQTYARMQILEEVQRKGYKLTKEENLADGTVRMVVQRWQ